MPPLRRSLLLLCLGAVLLGAWLIPPDARATRDVEAGLKRALISFATARALNAVISVAQGTEITLQIGVGATLAPGQVLDPVNDLVEQFSTLMLGASISFGVQRALIAIGGHASVSLLLTLVVLAWGWTQWRGATAHPLASRLASRALLALLLLRFAVPLVAIGNEAAFRWFLAEDYAAGQAAIENSTTQVTTLSPPPEEARPDEGRVERWKRWWSDKTDVGSRIEAMQRIAGEMVEHMLRLIVVFMLQTLVLPALLLWALLYAGRALLDWPRRER